MVGPLAGDFNAHTGMIMKNLHNSLDIVRVVISELALLMLMLILLCNFMFIEVMTYLHDNKYFERPTALFCP